MIKLDRIENALSKIETQKQDNSVNTVKASLEEVKESLEADSMTVQDALAALEEVYQNLSEIDKNDHMKIYAQFTESLNEAITEHMQILTDHADEILNQQ